MTLVWIVLGTLVGGLFSLLGAATILLVKRSQQERMLPRLVSFSTGALLAAAFLGMIPAAAEARDAEGLDAGAPGSVAPGSVAPGSVAPARKARLTFFWGVGCPHCEAAKPTVAALGGEFPGVSVEAVEVRQDPIGRARFVQAMRDLEVSAAGVPSFVIGREVIVGFSDRSTPNELRAMLRWAVGGADAGRAAPARSNAPIELPWIGPVDPAKIPFPAFTLLVGLVDGVNPCAMWVLLVLLSILVHVRSRLRLLLFGGTFVVASGVVYFGFMTAWIHVFSLVGLSRPITVTLGLVVLVMGLINLKELVWFKKGVSLMIPEKAKPGLFKRMREIGASASLPAAFGGIAVLALLVNLVELGCTLGLPAVYTRILTARAELTALQRYGFLALYNVAYVVPLALIVIVYGATLQRLSLSERGAKVLKAVSGVLLVAFGLLFILAPELLQ